VISAIKEQFTLKNLVEKVVIPLSAFLLLGLVQAKVFDWDQKIPNSSFRHAFEIGAYLLILALMYAFVVFPLTWLRPSLTIKMYKAGSSTIRPQTSEVLSQKGARLADVTMDIEFGPSWWTRKLYKWGKQEFGIRFSCLPKNVLTCVPNIAGDAAYSNYNGELLLLRPFGKMNLEDPDPFAQYNFRFALGTNQVVTRVLLRPRHMNLRSRLLFSLRFDTPFLLDIQQI
jgi:hypothetical protein